jgi:hypothetical protein
MEPWLIQRTVHVTELRSATTLDKSPPRPRWPRLNRLPDHTSQWPVRVGRHQGTGNAKDCSENETFGLVVGAGRKEYRNDSSNKSDDHCPEKTQHLYE